MMTSPTMTRSVPSGAKGPHGTSEMTIEMQPAPAKCNAASYCIAASSSREVLEDPHGWRGVPAGGTRVPHGFLQVVGLFEELGEQEAQ
eukprot:scaffold54797_cov60-Phaeocystis_antarctica.AAC.1